MTQKNKLKVKKNLFQSTLLSPFHCEISGGKLGSFLVLSGINSIRDFSDRAVLLRSSGFFVEITGDELSISVYENKTVEISGKIHSLELIYDKN